MRVVLGGVDIEKDEAYDQVIPVQKAVVHEAYNQTPFALYNDVGEAQMQLCTSITVHPLILFQLFGHYLHFPFFPLCFPAQPCSSFKSQTGHTVQRRLAL